MPRKKYIPIETRASVFLTIDQCLVYEALLLVDEDAAKFNLRARLKDMATSEIQSGVFNTARILKVGKFLLFLLL